MKRVGLIDFYLDEWHANNYPKWIEAHSDGELRVTHAFALIDSPLPGGRTTAQWCRDMEIEQSATIDSVVTDCDHLIVLSPDNSEMHEALCQVPLRSGKPTYIDKTFAPDLAVARRIFALAHARGTPCFSSSALRFAQEYQGLRAVLSIVSQGPGKPDTYGIHQIEPVMMLMAGQAQHAMAVRAEGSASLLLTFDSGRYASIACLQGGSPFSMTVCGAEGSKSVTAEDDFFQPFTASMVQFFRSGVPPVRPEETLAVMAAYSACMDAMRSPGEWIRVERV